ncbi:hypothetical protein [Enterobacter phage EspM4VN]|uniref:Rhamnogalacturonase A/B/Epimerase-like pectate lyase domain-containing protein n=1 Tax=Enterobacter phage EspM4VN TaxID=2137745 RepID=A0A4P2WV98_9CAUD|nr:tail fiber protein [Enterobacter phage EspM4VN]BBK03771.1 hypothetical protein [Enterobacter phage EspM4VN]
MTRNVESIFGAVVTAPHQIPYTYTATGGETFISLPFYPVTGFVTINGGVQVPVDNYEIDGNTINLGRTLEPEDVVYCLFDKILSPEDYADGIRIYKFQAVGTETSFTPDFTTYGVQTLYIDGKFQVPDINYSYSSTTGTVSFLTGSPTAGVWVVAEMSVKQPNISPLFDRTIQEVGRSTNLADTAVILSTDIGTPLDDKTVIYDVVAEKIYGLPTLPSNAYINTVSNGQLTYSPGNVTVDLVAIPDSAVKLKEELAEFDGESLVGVCPTVAILRTTEPKANKQLITVREYAADTGKGGGRFRAVLDGSSYTDNSGTIIKTTGGAAWIRVNDVVSVTDFGAVSDFNRDTNVGTDNTTAFQAAIDYCKVSHKALFVPSGWYLVSGNLTATYAIVMYGEGANGVSITTAAQQDSPFIGSVIVGGNTTGYTLNVSPPNYQFGLSIRNVAFYGLPAQRSNVNHKALRLHNTGLQGYVENVAISGYGGNGLVIGYLQDTHIISLFIERCGTLDVAAIKFEARANYVYFQDCLMMACHYFVDNTDATLFGRYIFWSGCHIEHGDYNGALGAEWDFYYNKTPFNIGAGSDWSFQNCIFIPVSNSGLATSLGISRLSTPYFMVCSGERFNMVNCRFNAPRDSVSSLALTGPNSRTAMITDTIFQGADGGRPCIDAYYAEITNCTFNLDISAYTDRCSGVYVRRGGAVKSCKFRLGATTGSRRTLGHLILTDDDRYEAINVSGNTYPDTTYVNAFVHRGCTISGEDGGTPRLVSITTTQSIDLSLYPTNVNFWVTAAVTITDILNGQYGRRVSVIANTAGAVINTTGNVYPKGNVNYTMTAGVPVEFRGMLDISGNRKMFQLAG